MSRDFVEVVGRCRRIGRVGERVGPDPSGAGGAPHPLPVVPDDALLGVVLVVVRGIAGCGHTACCTSRMRCRERSSREKRSFSGGQRPWMDYGHGLLVNSG